jgi:hypothetical protein
MHTKVLMGNFLESSHLEDQVHSIYNNNIMMDFYR